MDIEQIIPVKEAEDYLIKMADKAKEAESAKESSRGILALRKKYWGELLEEFNKVSHQFQNVNPGTDHWLSGGSGVSGVPFSFVVTKNYVSVELSISTSETDTNKMIFDALYSQKEEIEKDYGQSLNWQRLNDKKMSRISSRLENVDITNSDDWMKMKKFQCEAMKKLYSAIHDRLNKTSR